jgi:hypothetical protein
MVERMFGISMAQTRIAAIPARQWRRAIRIPATIPWGLRVNT